MKRLLRKFTCYAAMAAFMYAIDARAAGADYTFRVIIPGLQPAAGVPQVVAPPPPPDTTVWQYHDTTMLLSGNGLIATGSGVSAVWGNTMGSVAHSKGKWYWEVSFDSKAYGWEIGLVPQFLGGYFGAGDYWYQGYVHELFSNGASYSTTVATATTSTTIGVAADLDNGVLSFTVNCTPLATSLPLPTGSAFYPSIAFSTNQAGSGTADFGASAFKCTVPAGYTAGW